MDDPQEEEPVPRKKLKQSNDNDSDKDQEKKQEEKALTQQHQEKKPPPTSPPHPQIRLIEQLVKTLDHLKVQQRKQMAASTFKSILSDSYAEMQGPRFPTPPPPPSSDTPGSSSENTFNID